MENLLDKLSNDEIKALLNDSRSFREFLQKIGHSTNGSGSYRSIKNQLLKKEISIPLYSYSHLNSFFQKKKPISDILVENSTHPRHSVKNRIIKEGVIEYKCFKCENKGEWLNEKISLQLEHKNGINNDNRIENLCFLCPNCHSQTNTYGGKSRKKVYYCECGGEKYKYSSKCMKCSNKGKENKNKPDKIQLFLDVENLGYCGSGKKYGVSDNCIRKWKKVYEKEI